MKKILIFLAVSIFLGLLIFGFTLKQWIWGENIKQNLESYELLIPTGSDYDSLMKILKDNDLLENYSSFDFVAGAMNYKKSKIRPGRYVLKPGMSNRELINLLRSGKQTPVNITFNNVRKIDELMGKVSHYIEADSISLVKLIQDSAFISKLGYNKYTILSMFIPNTYELYWNTDARHFVAS